MLINLTILQFDNDANPTADCNEPGYYITCLKIFDTETELNYRLYDNMTKTVYT